MKVLNEKPPDWIMKGCMDSFRIDMNHTVWTFGDTIFNPGGGEIPDHVLEHESHHAKQQEEFNMDDQVQGGLKGPEGWWKRYLADPRFRLEQEAEAYGVQYGFFCKHKKDRNERFRFLFHLSGQLSGALYQVAVSREQAKAMIEILSGQKTVKQALKT